ncbi:MAG: TPM domain-containing protein [Lachnospiraceae bacterium]|nr:TPM domain-containing protein [Lachnospiraceae bacterium]
MRKNVRAAAALLCAFLCAVLLTGAFPVFAEEAVLGYGENTQDSDYAYRENNNGDNIYVTNNGTVITMPLITDKTKRIFDYAELFSDQQEEELLKSIEKIQDRLKGDVVILTTNDIPEDNYYGSVTSRKYCEQFYLDNGFAKDGFIYLIDLNNRILWTAGTGEFAAEKYNSLEDKIYNAALSEAKNGKYYGTAVVCLDYLDRIHNIPRAAVPNGISLIVSGFAALLSIIIFAAKHHRTQPSVANTPMVKANDYKTLNHDCRFLGKTVTKRHIPKNTGGGGGSIGGGTSSGGFSSGGSSFSGGGGHF